METETVTAPDRSEEIKRLLGPGNFRKISRDTGFARQHVSRALRGISGMSTEAAAKIMNSTGVTFEELNSHVASVKKPKPRKPRQAKVVQAGA